jgi:uncharacterized protein
VSRPVRGIRFAHPDLDPGEPSGLRVAAAGGLGVVEGADAVRQALLLLLTTRPGERVMRPTYGCDLHTLVFAPSDGTTEGLAIHYVRSAIERWEPRVEIVRLDAMSAAEEPGRLDVLLEYRARATQWTDHLEFSLSLTGD